MDRVCGKDRLDLPLGVVKATQKQTPLKSCPDPARFNMKYRGRVGRITRRES